LAAKRRGTRRGLVPTTSKGMESRKGILISKAQYESKLPDHVAALARLNLEENRSTGATPIFETLKREWDHTCQLAWNPRASGSGALYSNPLADSGEAETARYKCWLSRVVKLPGSHPAPSARPPILCDMASPLSRMSAHHPHRAHWKLGSHVRRTLSGSYAVTLRYYRRLRSLSATNDLHQSPSGQRGTRRRSFRAL
jgi:hypothetical protein